MSGSVTFDGSRRVLEFQRPGGGIVVQSNSNGGTCKARTGNGRPCRNPAAPGSQLCGRHDRGDKPSPWWWTNAPELLRAWDEESVEADDRQRLELKRLFGPPRSRRGRSVRTNRAGRGGMHRPSSAYLGRDAADET
jgi:hypothetical protein